jgi:hypothetical protein
MTAAADFSSPAQRGRGTATPRRGGVVEGAQGRASQSPIIRAAALRPLRHGAARRATSPAARVRRSFE